MTLDNQLRALQELEVGSVERVIGDVERIKNGIQKAHESFETELENYKHLIEEKLPRIIQNIITLGRYVVGQDTCSAGYEKTTIIKYEKNFYSVSKGSNPEFEIVFDGTASVWQIRLKKSGFFDRKWFNPRRWTDKPEFYSSETLPFSRAKTPEEFCSKYLDLVIPEIRSYGKSNLMSLPFKLNEVPQEIMEIYQHRKEQKESFLASVQSHNGRLESLDVSDFK